MKLKELNKIITQGSDKELLDFIQVEFLPAKDSSSTNVRNNYNTLKKIPDDVLNIGIARLKRIEEKSDFPKTTPIIIPFVLLIITAYSEWAKILPSESAIGQLLILLLSVYTFAMVVSIFGNEKGKKIKAIYFRELLESVEKKDNR
ncbi:hypothetical protein ACQCT3_18075 [Sutcliffiella horikoshii]|uniref:hypothetical protein n=1 Tax=Sutcliffiella horikoshii TaxID=79883 RepID=UPI003CF03855